MNCSTRDDIGNETELKDYYGQPANHQSAQQAIIPFKKNNSYWQYKGMPVFLLGGNIDDNTFQLSRMELTHYLDELRAVGGNYIRNVMSDRDEGNIVAFKRLESGKFDLDEWNEKYWKKFRYMLASTAKRDIIVHVTLWDRFDHYDNVGSTSSWAHRRWIESPWNPANNINYTSEVAGLEPTYKGHPSSGKNPFFKTPPAMENNPVVLHYQQKFIRKIMDIGFEYGNVIYNMGNEHQVTLKDWDRYWCEFIRDYAFSKGNKIETSAMFDHQNWQPVTEGSDIYTFVEGSKVGSQWTAAGETQYDVALELIANTNKNKRRPVNAVKVRTQKIVFNAQERLWRPLMAGFAAVSHHRNTYGAITSDGWPVGGLGFTELAKTNIKAMRIFTDIIKPWECEPRQDLLKEREEDEAYLMAKEDEMYGLYFPQASGSVGLDLRKVAGSCKVQWIDIGKGQVLETKKSKGAE